MNENATIDYFMAYHSVVSNSSLVVELAEPVIA